MGRFRCLHRQFAWLALCAVVFGAFAPSVSRLLAVANQTTWVDICSATGTKRIAADQQSQESPESPLVADSHCGYCVLQHFSPALPSVPRSWAPPPASSHRLALGGDTSALPTRLVRDAYHSRAPPVLS